MVHQENIHLSTQHHGEMHDLTDKVNSVVKKSGIKIGMAHIFNIGSTGAIGTIEFEPGLQRDLPELLNKLIPPSREYGHEQMWHDGSGENFSLRLTADSWLPVHSEALLDASARLSITLLPNGIEVVLEPPRD
jgi:thiamine phosphate synthase YjbQ (UPF0047 family)